MTDTDVLRFGVGVGTAWLRMGAELTNRQGRVAEVGTVVWIEHMIDRRLAGARDGERHESALVAGVVACTERMS